MSIVRSFTTRRFRGNSDATADTTVTRAASHRIGKSVNRAQISSPLALISTSNVLLNNAQHITGTSEIQFTPETPSSPGGASSGDDSDMSASSSRNGNYVTDASSVDESPLENHLSCYFKSSTASVQSSSHSITSAVADSPSIPKRQPSHSKRAHESVHRQRSIRRMMSPPPATSRELSRTSAEIFGQAHGSSVEAPKESPFGNELAQLDVVAEEFGLAVRDAEASQDMVVMESHGLARFDASDYLNEIQSLLSETFYNNSAAATTEWI